MEGDQETDSGIGLRFSHFTPWIDGEGFGYSIFDQSQFIQVAQLRLRSAAFSGMRRIALYRWGDSDAGTVLPAAHRRRIRCLRSRQYGSSWRLGPLLLSFWTVHERS